ncbi:MAG TPA: hypothetical protein PK109_00820 [Candidatus Paceibacterota bacterium]|nr:hypothetical protein [Candidatus Paceibacterota bacterium]
MTRNPFLNALATVTYIAVVAAFLSFVPKFIPEPVTPIAPILGMLSLFVFSAAVTGYLMLGVPLQLLLEGQKKEGIALFAKTLVAFAGIAAVLSGVVLSLSL